MVKFESNPDITVSSRIRLARNIESYPFPEWAGSRQLEQVKKKVGAFSRKLNLRLLSFERLSKIQKRIYVEKNIISPQFVSHNGDGKALLIDSKGEISVMINEEDHLRIQGVGEDIGLCKIWNKVNTIDDTLSSEIPFAFSQNLGFFTACPTNLGTAMRASVMMHLPAVVFTKRIYPLVKTLSEKGIHVRGMFGEGTVAYGNTFQISNQRTLGITEQSIIELIEQGHQEVLNTEIACRKKLLRRDKIFIEDKVQRAVGLLKFAELLTLEEALDLLSTIKLGVSLSILKGKTNLKKINILTTKVQAAHLCQSLKKELSDIEEKRARARLIRKELKL